MKISSINSNNVENIYKTNKIKQQNQIHKKKDTVEISDLGKYLSKVSSENKEIDIEKINEIKKRISNNTYNIDSKDIAKKMIEHYRRNK